MNTPTITLESDYIDTVSANWSDEMARYHVWIYRVPAGWHIEETIYKNPPLVDGRPCRSSEPGYFQTRTLDLTNKANAPIYAALKALATPDKCESVAAEAKAARDAKAAQAATEARRAYLAKCVADIQAAGGDELAAVMLDATPESAALVEQLRLEGIRTAARTLASATVDEMTAAAPAKPAERIDENGTRYIDVSPTWESWVSVCVQLIENGDSKGRADAIAELQRMGRIADAAALQARIAKG